MSEMWLDSSGFSFAFFRFPDRMPDETLWLACPRLRRTGSNCILLRHADMLCNSDPAHGTRVEHSAHKVQLHVQFDFEVAY